MPAKKASEGGKHNKGQTVRKRNVTRVIPSPKTLAGNQTLFLPEHVDKAYKLCLFGLTNEQLAEAFDITTSTISDWARAHPEFKEALWRGREGADLEVIESLRQSALGFEHASEEIKVVSIGEGRSEIVRVPVRKKYAPNALAGMYWLNNRQRDRWRRAPENEGGQANDPGEAARAAQAAIAASMKIIDNEGE